MSNKQVSELITKIKSSLQQKDEVFSDQGAWKKELRDILKEFQELNFKEVTTQYLELRKALADYIDSVFCFYRDNIGIKKFIREFKKILNEFNPGNLNSFPETRTKIGGKRMPDFDECCRATLDRLEAINNVSQQLSGSVEGMIVGGSISYGRFYNIRETHPEEDDNSDIDTLVIVKDIQELRSLIKVSSLNPEDRKLFQQRLKEFEKMKTDIPKILSQKFYYKGRDFTISFHCFPWETVKKMVTQLSFNLWLGIDDKFFIKDFRSDPNKNLAVHCNFNGDQINSDFRIREYGHHSILFMPLYLIHQGEFYSGVYLNVILPERWMILDRENIVSGITKEILDLLSKRLELEKKQNPQKSILKSHIRYPLFRDSISV